MIIADNWTDVAENAWRWPNFTPEEMACHGTGSIRVSRKFMDRLQGLRDIIAQPLVITSGYREAGYDKSIGGAGVHPTGLAADIQCCGETAARIATIALQMFPGVGIKQKGLYERRFIHVDMMPEDDPARPRPWIWSY